MPNHCYNILTIASPDRGDLAKIKEHLKGKDSDFDFNQLVPIPPQVQDLSVLHMDGKQYYYSQKAWEDRKLSPVAWEETEDIDSIMPTIEWIKKNHIDDFTVRRLKGEHGSAWWYDWCVEHWGTKWNAYDVEQGINNNTLVYHFTTAWAEPRPVIRALMEYLSQPGFDQDLEMRWSFKEEMEHFQGVITLDDEV